MNTGTSQVMVNKGLMIRYLHRKTPALVSSLYRARPWFHATSIRKRGGSSSLDSRYPQRLSPDPRGTRRPYSCHQPQKEEDGAHDDMDGQDSLLGLDHLSS